ncbi:Glutaredoxin-like protein NrdH [Paucilactobacillus oligofermentans DSM 15707 = LMG 22743]|uniref:glutaredoxin-like protein NrdH n=1 Tax=Paucilactobacillus oligofermentans TaxID=293371 RepID=UPI00070DD848|nr:glutaredoxin-like protein NrdH [Paucilactobacillus oligofermentans]CUS26746.1 Glutaredoxin-like protein NrdH [Paucilactobacillus oligofermentans DSM 15707 = LMG 22743]
MGKVTLFSKNNCMQCKMTKRFLAEHNVEFIEHNIDEQPEFIDSLKAEGFQATPVIKLGNGDSFTGFRPDVLSQLAI